MISAGEHTFLWTGCQGDCIAGLAVIRQLGGGHLHIGNHHLCGDGYHKPICGARYEALAPLLRAQSYVKSVSYDESQKVDHDSSNWRMNYQRNRSLAESQAAFFGLKELDLSPWIKVDASKETQGRVIITRSLRYRNHSFPWSAIVRKYKDKCLFLGFPDEHADFHKLVKQRVEWRRTNDLLEMAQLIAGSELLVANQSCPSWIAMGMGHPLIQETSSKNPDSRIYRENAQFVQGSSVKLPNL